MEEIKFKVNVKELDGTVTTVQVNVDDANNVTFEKIEEDNDNNG